MVSSIPIILTKKHLRPQTSTPLKIGQILYFVNGILFIDKRVPIYKIFKSEYSITKDCNQ